MRVLYVLGNYPKISETYAEGRRGGVTAPEFKDFWRERIVAKHAATMRRHA